MSAAAPPAPGPADDAGALPPGYRINEYEIDRTLGGGGFGITYLARDANLDLPVAIKEYYPGDLALRGADSRVQLRTADAEQHGQFEWGLERFLDEARALATFRHPNIVRVLRYFRANGTAYIVMEYESGLPLKRWIPQNAPLSQRTVLGVVYPLLDGLEQVHKAGFLHRDIKPDNIYVRADGQPVLLDFGSARRVQANHDLTNIVSPGFAPFEQYHSQGHQGPWTDIYSLGAVMYWMVTGRKPVESAARVKSDSMAPALDVGDAGVFGAELLRAIDWAMQPDEARRPQSVPEFRSAIRGSERPEMAHRATTQRLDAGPHAHGPSIPVASGSTSSGTSGTHRRNLLGTILFLDLVGYSVKSVDHQAQVKRLLNELIGKALRGVPEDSRIAIDTGDGAAICFMGDPEEALHSALLLRDLLGQRYGNAIAARIGLHMGPVRVVSDINDRLNVIGDGINVAQRVMDFAQPNQVLVSRAYYDVISRITDDGAAHFQYLGQYEDKHGRQHEVYAAESALQGKTQRQGPSTGYTQTVPTPTTRAIADQEVHDLEAELARHIGPLAKVLVRKALPLAGSLEALREAVAHSIPDQRARDLFLAGAPHHGHSHPPSSQSMPLISRPLGPTHSRSRGGSAPPQLSRPAAPSQPVSRPPAGVTQPAGGSSRSGTLTGRALEVTPEELAALEAGLGRHVGPMARVIVRKEMARAPDLKHFVVALAENIDQRAGREAFLELARRALHKRSF